MQKQETKKEDKKKWMEEKSLNKVKEKNLKGWKKEKKKKKKTLNKMKKVE